MDTPTRNGTFVNKQNCDYIQEKAKRISELFDSLSDSPSTASAERTLSIGDVSIQIDSPQKSHPRSQEEFFKRVSSFEPGFWTVEEITPLVCASWGWKLIEKDVLQCVSCHEVICATLPNKKYKEAYEKFLHSLEDRIENDHKDACGWLYNPFPREMFDPLAINGEYIRNMKNSVQTLTSLNSALPFLNNTRLLAVLGADDEVIKGLLKSDDEVDDDIRVTAVLLVLSGWAKGQGPFLRCKVCQRLVGLWSLISIADEMRKKEASTTNTDSSTSRKRKLSEAAESPSEDEDNRRVTRQSPRKNKHPEQKDSPTPKRMKTRSQDSKMEENINTESRGRKMECLLITSPTTEVEKVEKVYFNPLEEHRHWCLWITKLDDTITDEEEDDDPPKGFCMVTEQIRTILQVSEQRKSVACEKYVENVEGLRIIRNLLDEASSD